MRHRPLHVAIGTVLCAALLGAPPATADDDRVTFAGRAHAEHAMDANLGRCGVCGSPRFESHQMVEVLGGRYQFDQVEQAYCPVCQVTTLNVDRTQKSARLVRLLWWKVPAARGKVQHTADRFALALASSDTTPFISAIFGFEKQGETYYFNVE